MLLFFVFLLLTCVVVEVADGVCVTDERESHHLEALLCQGLSRGQRKRWLQRERYLRKFDFVQFQLRQLHFRRTARELRRQLTDDATRLKDALRAVLPDFDFWTLIVYPHPNPADSTTLWTVTCRVPVGEEQALRSAVSDAIFAPHLNQEWGLTLHSLFALVARVPARDAAAPPLAPRSSGSCARPNCPDPTAERPTWETR